MNAGPIAPPVLPDTEECWAEVDNHRMRYLRAGTGPPILLIHGLMAYSFSWRLTIPTLASMRTIYAPDLLGTGYSDHPAEMDFSITASAQRLWEFLDTIGVIKADIVGSSLGGAIGTRMAASHPERVNKLVLVSPVNPWSRHGRWIARLLATKPGGRMFVGMLPLIRATGDFWLKRLFGDPERIPPGTLEGYTMPLLQPTAWDYGLSIMKSWKRDLLQLESDYSALANTDALLVWGSRDRAVYVSSAKEMRKRMSKAKLTVFEGAGHMPYEEVPDDFNRELVSFLSR